MPGMIIPSVVVRGSKPDSHGPILVEICRGDGQSGAEEEAVPDASADTLGEEQLPILVAN